MVFSKAFLEDEVRLGFYIPATIKQAWAAELEVLNVIDKICEKLGIEYFADWGTFLGAIRHHGFIPWDDDFDIVMRREDYDRFYKEAPELFPEGYNIHTFRNEEGFKEFHAVVVNAKAPNFNKEHYDRFHGFCYLCGIDIFILDYVYEDDKKEDERVKDTLYLISLGDSILNGELSPKEISSNIEHIEKITNEKLSHIKDNKELAIRIYELADAKCAEVKREESDILTQMVPWGLKKLSSARYHKADYDKAIRIPFEYTTVPVPTGYDNLLSQRYGNYMKIHKAAGAHEYPFYEKQIKDLEALLDFSLPKYTFEPANLKNRQSNEENWKSLVNEALNHLESINSRIRFDNSEEALDVICSSQELAIDMGNLIEQVKGENIETIKILNDYCENLYQLYLILTEEDKGKDNILELINNSFCSLYKSVNDLLSRKEVVFLPFKASAWDSFEDIYNSCISDDKMDVYVVPIPYYYKEYDGSLSDEQYDLTSYPENINLIGYKDYSLEFHHPDIIFIQNPYDEFNASTSIHPQFYSSIIKNYTDKLVYVPWFNSSKIEKDSDSRSYKNMDYYVTMPGVVNSDYTLVRTETEKEAYILKLKEWSQEDIWQKKVCMNNGETLSKLEITDNYETQKDAEEGKNKHKYLMYYIGAGQTFQNASSFIKKFKENISIFENNMDKISVVLVLDCMLEKTMKEYNPKLWNDFSSELNRINEIKGIQVLLDNDNREKLLHFDAYYGDASFLTCEYSETGKPVMIQNYNI